MTDDLRREKITYFYGAEGRAKGRRCMGAALQRFVLDPWPFANSLFVFHVENVWRGGLAADRVRVRRDHKTVSSG